MIIPNEYKSQVKTSSQIETIFACSPKKHVMCYSDGILCMLFLLIMNAFHQLLLSFDLRTVLV